jgi:hypothetical protein
MPQNIENNPMQSNGVSLAAMLSLSPQKHFDTSGKSVALIHHPANCKTPMTLPDGRPMVGPMRGSIQS